MSDPAAVVASLRKKKANKRCADCTSRSATYISTKFWTFICSDCASAHLHLSYPAKGISTSVISKKEADNLARMGNARSNSVYMGTFREGDYDIPTPRSEASARQTFVHLKYEAKRWMAEDGAASVGSSAGEPAAGFGASASPRSRATSGTSAGHSARSPAGGALAGASGGRSRGASAAATTKLQIRMGVATNRPRGSSGHTRPSRLSGPRGAPRAADSSATEDAFGAVDAFGNGPPTAPPSGAGDAGDAFAFDDTAAPSSAPPAAQDAFSFDSPPPRPAARTAAPADDFGFDAPPSKPAPADDFGFDSPPPRAAAASQSPAPAPAASAAADDFGFDSPAPAGKPASNGARAGAPAAAAADDFGFDSPPAGAHSRSTPSRPAAPKAAADDFGFDSAPAATADDDMGDLFGASASPEESAAKAEARARAESHQRRSTLTGNLDALYEKAAQERAAAQQAAMQLQMQQQQQQQQAAMHHHGHGHGAFPHSPAPPASGSGNPFGSPSPARGAPYYPAMGPGAAHGSSVAADPSDPFSAIAGAPPTYGHSEASAGHGGMPAPGMPAPGMPAPGMPAPGMPAPGMPAPPSHDHNPFGPDDDAPAAYSAPRAEPDPFAGIVDMTTAADRFQPDKPGSLAQATITPVKAPKADGPPPARQAYRAPVASRADPFGAPAPAPAARAPPPEPSHSAPEEDLFGSFAPPAPAPAPAAPAAEASNPFDMF
ncbi:hypothetical protein FNF29_00533 [Cafeteria roenbergensis]|uniref:Arf-GAP domain-containing protein n=1 Tax=Cafeteria roenbergensis TaxID=33653 RepID=A0A5A8CZG2_CAFRO|nr:hypothetical protein FNF29_00533 [Cafeteria roenbergensis]|eukprot:KAA0157181.1 hypothetical protein FNF29_00533 [Cafeteria roenbergensis]